MGKNCKGVSRNYDTDQWAAHIDISKKGCKMANDTRKELNKTEQSIK